MKKIILVVFALIPGVLLAQNKTFTIKGKIGHLDKPAKVYLLYVLNDKSMIDSAKVIAGTFELQGTVSEAMKAALILSHDGSIGYHQLHGKRDRLDFMIEPQKININVTDSISKAVITGSKVNQDYKNFNTAMNPYTVAYAKQYAEYRAATAEQRKSKVFDKKFDDIDSGKRVAELEFVKHNPNSAVSLYALQEYAGYLPNIGEISTLFNALSASVRNSPTGKTYHAYLLTALTTEVGRIAPDFAQPDTNGRKIALSSFRGKYVLVDFWASWCGPCRAENPTVVAAYKKYHDRGLEILGVSMDQPDAKAAWIKAIHDDHLSWPQVSDLKFWKSDVVDLYSIKAIPLNFLIGPDGTIVAKNLRGERLETTLSQLLNK